jgi:beta-glucosidase
MEKDDVSIDIEEKTPPLPEISLKSKLASWCRRYKLIVILVAAMILLLPLLGLLVLRKTTAHWTSPIVYPSPRGYGAGNWSEAVRVMTGTLL